FLKLSHTCNFKEQPSKISNSKKYNPELKLEEIEGRRRSGIMTRTNSRIRVAFLHVNFFMDFCAGNESTFEATSPTEKTTTAPSTPDRSRATQLTPLTHPLTSSSLHPNRTVRRRSQIRA
ncbi:hypothetical protein RYX36_013691, partial [Vicia faba]